jgi:hypothetical protein
MTKSWAPIFATLSASLFLAATLACGGSNRQLRSISITPTGVIEGNMIQLQFVAAGAFNASPTAVDPLPVSWYVVPQATAAVYTLTSQPFDIACQTGSSSSRSPRRILTHPTAARSPAKSSRTWSSIIRSARKAALSRPLFSMRHAPSRRVRNHFGISRCTTFTRYPALCRRLLTSSAIITERCWPPVQPKPRVR